MAGLKQLAAMESPHVAREAVRIRTSDAAHANRGTQGIGEFHPLLLWVLLAAAAVGLGSRVRWFSGNRVHVFLVLGRAEVLRLRSEAIQRPAVPVQNAERLASFWPGLSRSQCHGWTQGLRAKVALIRAISQALGLDRWLAWKLLRPNPTRDPTPAQAIVRGCDDMPRPAPLLAVQGRGARTGRDGLWLSCC